MYKKTACSKMLACLFAFIALAGFFMYTARAEGELESVYKQYSDAVKNLDVDGLKKVSAAEVLARINATPPDQVTSEMETMKKLHHNDAVITGENINGDEGVISLTGTSSLTGAKQNGTVHLVRENGEWKIKQERWKNPAQ
jgi:hypothetical protein